MDDTLSGIPPQNLDAEASLLGSLIIDTDAFIKIADQVKPEDFYSHQHKAIFSAMSSLHDKRSPIDILTLSEQLKSSDELDNIGGASYLTELTNFVPTAAHVEKYAEIVADKSIRRRLIKASQDIAKVSGEEAKTIVAVLSTQLCFIAWLLKPVMPETSEKIISYLNGCKKPEKPLFLRKD